MLSGLLDAGSWGGVTRADMEVRIQARNRKCCSVLSSFLNDWDQLMPSLPSIANRSNKIAVVYGVFHLEDLKRRFVEELSLEFDESYRISLPVWTLSTLSTLSETAPDKERDSRIVWSKVPPEEFWQKAFSLPSALLVLIGSASLYVGAGVVDWWTTIELVVRTVERISLGLEGSMSDEAIDILAAVTYVWIYLQRHWWCLQRISYAGIEWNRGLFG